MFGRRYQQITITPNKPERGLAAKFAIFITGLSPWQSGYKLKYKSRGNDERVRELLEEEAPWLYRRLPKGSTLIIKVRDPR